MTHTGNSKVGIQVKDYWDFPINDERLTEMEFPPLTFKRLKSKEGIFIKCIYHIEEESTWCQEVTSTNPGKPTKCHGFGPLTISQKTFEVFSRIKCLWR
jgi:hypothetical protein